MSRIWLITGAAFIASVVVDLVVGAEPPGLISAYGFVGCAVIVIASKWLGKVFVQARPGYYQGEPAEAATDGGREADEGDGGA